DPSEDLSAVFAALRAVLVIRGPDGSRTVPARDFFVGPYETVLSPGELLVEIRVPLRSSVSAYVKVDRRAGDWAVGAAGAVLTVVERAVVGAAKSRANRLANADHANLVRTSRAAGQQLKALRRLERRGGLERLPDELRDLAELRLAHPSISLRELGLKCRPPATKATVHRRLKKLIRLAES
ncbi:MAG TPA: DNA-binding protein WhiA, partial [Gaiellaceae bacterium]|nr:DNA-binding protein WhiA [Gaiellaceae bacterium]